MKCPFCGSKLVVSPLSRRSEIKYYICVKDGPLIGDNPKCPYRNKKLTSEDITKIETMLIDIDSE